MTDPKLLTTAQAATRLGVDASRVVRYINHGLVVRRAIGGKLGVKIYLRAVWRVRNGHNQWGIRPTSVREFNARRGAR